MRFELNPSSLLSQSLQRFPNLTPNSSFRIYSGEDASGAGFRGPEDDLPHSDVVPGVFCPRIAVYNQIRPEILWNDRCTPYACVEIVHRRLVDNVDSTHVGKTTLSKCDVV